MSCLPTKVLNDLGSRRPTIRPYLVAVHQEYELAAVRDHMCRTESGLCCAVVLTVKGSAMTASTAAHSCDALMNALMWV